MQGAPQGGRGITPTGFCVTTGSVPGDTQQVQQQSSSCYVPAAAASPRADAGVLQLVLFGVLLGLAMVAESR